MTNETVYQAIFETEKHSVSIVYEHGPEGTIFIVSCDITERPTSPFQIRAAELLRDKPRQMELFGLQCTNWTQENE
jgi:hypothetical protein